MPERAGIKKSWSQSLLCDHVERLNSFEDRLPGLHPNPNRNPAQAVAIWKGGVRERADGAFLCMSIKKRRSKADFAPTWNIATL